MEYKKLSDYKNIIDNVVYSAIRYEINKAICVGFRVPTYHNDGFISFVITDELYNLFMSIPGLEYEFQKELFASADEVRKSFNIGAPSGYNIKRYLAGRPALNEDKTSFVSGQMIISVPLPHSYFQDNTNEFMELNIFGHYVNLEVDFLRSAMKDHFIGIDTVIADRITDNGKVNTCFLQEPIVDDALADYLIDNYFEERISKISVLDFLNSMLCLYTGEQRALVIDKWNSKRLYGVHEKLFDVFVDSLGAYICEIGEGYKRRFTGSDANFKELSYILNELLKSFENKDERSSLEMALNISWGSVSDKCNTRIGSQYIYKLRSAISESIDEYYDGSIAQDGSVVDDDNAQSDRSLVDFVVSGLMQCIERMKSDCLREPFWQEVILGALVDEYSSKDDVECRAFDFFKDVMFIQSLFDAIIKVFKDSGCFGNLSDSNKDCYIEKMSKDINKYADEIYIRAPYIYQKSYRKFTCYLKELIDNCICVFRELADYWNINKYHGIDTVHIVLAFVDAFFPKAKLSVFELLSKYYVNQDFDYSLADEITEFKDIAKTEFIR
ncbi:MAG: hypothetical protein K6E72_01690 [Saccharofermentans sp.]|nr:hypothetical protein [Saccharofermentans sp.]